LEPFNFLFTYQIVQIGQGVLVKRSSRFFGTGMTPVEARKRCT